MTGLFFRCGDLEGAHGFVQKCDHTAVLAPSKIAAREFRPFPGRVSLRLAASWWAVVATRVCRGNLVGAEARVAKIGLFAEGRRQGEA